MKLNNKGYMLVEIIVASVIALVMAYFLIDITIRLVNKNNDYYVESVLLTDKNLVTKEIMEDINDNSNNDILLIKINVTNSGDDIVTAELSFNDGNSKNLVIDKSNNIIKYGNYEKKLSDNLSIKEFNISKDSTQKQLYIRIPAYTNYSDIDYGINLVIPYTEDIEVVLPTPTKKDQVCNPDTGDIPNCPDLAEGLIPVMYYNNNWVVANIEDMTDIYGWYNYGEKKWANAVLVSDTNREEYLHAKAGTLVTYSDILAFYVWIPSYKYKVWNINKAKNVDSYNARTTGIDIVFENDPTNHTGTINCTYFYSSLSTTPNETCNGSNGDYYTHPAFTFGGVNINGFWMGKFELSSEKPDLEYGGGNSTTLTPRILPNVTSWRWNNIGEFFTVIQNMQTSNNIYGLSTDKNAVDSHMITNMEWGAVAYLTNSKYGRCTDGSCKEIMRNNCSKYITGIGGNYGYGESASETTCTTATNKYDGTKGMLASTTGNIYGVYDMSGGISEYVMANMSSTSGSYNFYSASSGLSQKWYNDNNKYLTTYAYNPGTNATNINTLHGRLGDATGEVQATSNLYGWYEDFNQLPYSKYPWLNRGGYMAADPYTGIFNSMGSLGTADNLGTRATLVSLK